MGRNVEGIESYGEKCRGYRQKLNQEWKNLSMLEVTQRNLA